MLIRALDLPRSPAEPQRAIDRAGCVANLRDLAKFVRASSGAGGEAVTPGDIPHDETAGTPESNRGTRKTNVCRPRRDRDQPSQDRQNDILAAITVAGMPLTRPELIEAMKLKTEGKLGHHLAWMVTNNILVNLPNTGYWPANRPAPE
jgi:hypothetical protein